VRLLGRTIKELVMPWRLIQFIVVFVVFLLFIGLNLENKCDIKFGSDKMILKDVPVYFTVFCSFIIGMLGALPFILGIKYKKKTDVVQGKDLLKKIAERKSKKSSFSKETKTQGEATSQELRDKSLSNKDYGID
jgi:cadmium resistance protein CadD (predicted permease)